MAGTRLESRPAGSEETRWAWIWREFDRICNLLSALSGVPVGSIVGFGGSSVPASWLLCDGQAVSRTDFPDLFLAIGEAYGPGDTAITFNVPDLRGRVLLGDDAMGGSDAGRITASTVPGSVGGLETPSSTTAENPVTPVTVASVTTGGRLPPYQTSNWIIKAA